MEDKKKYVLREQTATYLKQAKQEFARSLAKISMNPEDIIEASVSTRKPYAYAYITNDDRIWAINIDTFNKYFVPYIEDDTYLLNKL